LRYGDWKGVKLNVGDSTKTVFELYDLSADVHEDNNLATAHPELVERISFLMDSVHTHSDMFNFHSGER